MKTLPKLAAGTRRFRLLRLVLIGGLQAAVAVGLALEVQTLFNQVTDGESWALSASQLAIWLFLVLGAGSLRWLAQVEAERLGQGYVHQLRLRLYRHLLQLGSEPLRRRSRAVLALRFVGDLTAVRNWVSLGVARLLVSGTALVAAIAALLWIAPVVALAVLVSVLLVWGAAAAVSPALRAQTQSVRQARGRLAALLGDRLDHLSLITHFNRERAEWRRFRRRSRAVRNGQLKRADLVGRLRALGEASALLLGVLILLLGSWLVSVGWATAGSLLAALLVSGFLTPRMQELTRVVEYWNAYRVARDKQLQLLRIQPQADPVCWHFDQPQDGVAVDQLVMIGRFAAQSFTLSFGESAVLMGANGCGKSSLLRVLAGVERADTGRICGIDRARVVLVAPEIRLLRGSIAFNLAYAQSTHSALRWQQVLRVCELEELFARLPEGLETRITDGDSQFSTGERLRIYLARALLAEPRLLLLDEPDANLDGQGWRVLRRVLQRFPGIWIASTHSPRLAQLAHQRIEMQPNARHLQLLTKEIPS